MLPGSMFFSVCCFPRWPVYDLPHIDNKHCAAERSEVSRFPESIPQRLLPCQDQLSDTFAEAPLSLPVPARKNKQHAQILHANQQQTFVPTPKIGDAATQKSSLLIVGLSVHQVNTTSCHGM